MKQKSVKDKSYLDKDRRAAELAAEIAQLAYELNIRTEELRKELGHWRHHDDDSSTGTE